MPESDWRKAVVETVSEKLFYGTLSVAQARLKLLSATNRRLTGEEVAAIVTILDGMTEAVCDDAQLFRAAAQMVEARARGNQRDFWRAIGTIEALMCRNGDGQEEATP